MCFYLEKIFILKLIIMALMAYNFLNNSELNYHKSFHCEIYHKYKFQL